MLHYHTLMDVQVDDTIRDEVIDWTIRLPLRSLGVDGLGSLDTLWGGNLGLSTRLEVAHAGLARLDVAGVGSAQGYMLLSPRWRVEMAGRRD
jgi:hypothetical protein